MTNPWEEISLSDYENHMKLDSVMQLQNLNQMMKDQFSTYPVSSVMVWGLRVGMAWNTLIIINLKKYMVLILTENIWQRLQEDIQIFQIYWNVYN